ncbi:MAG TPA: hypothetical protein VH561_04645 [Micromonosporaceae bacterium]|jgi:hypothetical protein
MVARIASAERWAREPDRVKATQPARDAKFARYLDRVPADLPQAERIRRAELLRTADMQRLALRSAQARRKRREADEELRALEAVAS